MDKATQRLRGAALAFAVYMHKQLVLAVGVAIALGACRGGRQDGAPTSPSAAETARPRSLSAPVMLHHEIYAMAIRDALVRGDLDAARRNAQEISAAKEEGSPEVIDYAHAMKSAAAGIVCSPDLASASRATGALVKSCSDCHARLAGPTRLTVEPAPAAEKGRRPRMRRHIWAMYELWDGLVGNSEDPWRAGAEVLADPTLASAELVPPMMREPKVETLAASIQSLGARARAASDMGVRAEVYGELLATCADCHARTR